MKIQEESSTLQRRRRAFIDTPAFASDTNSNSGVVGAPVSISILDDRLYHNWFPFLYSSTAQRVDILGDLAESYEVDKR